LTCPIATIQTPGITVSCTGPKILDPALFSISLDVEAPSNVRFQDLGLAIKWLAKRIRQTKNEDSKSR